MNRILLFVFAATMVIPAMAQKGLKEFYYPPQSKLFDPRHYFKTLQYYNEELASIQPLTKKDSVDKANIYYLRGRCKFELTDKRGAIEDMTLAIALNKEQESYYYYRALAQHWLKRFNEAIDDYNQAILLNPGKYSYYINRGFCKHLSGNEDKACYDFSKAGELGSFDIYEIIKEYCN
jgi:tetratricopeptide (TPR) repeat protein